MIQSHERNKVIPEILKPLKLVLCSSREIVSLNFLKNLTDFQYFTADRMRLFSPPNSNGWTIPLMTYFLPGLLAISLFTPGKLS
jgi:hypothetical protein